MAEGLPKESGMKIKVAKGLTGAGWRRTKGGRGSDEGVGGEDKGGCECDGADMV